LNTTTGVRIVTIGSDGRVDVNPRFATDEAASAFWDAVREMAPPRFRQLETGGTYVLEFDHVLRNEQVQEIREHIARQNLKVDILIVEAGGHLRKCDGDR